MIWNDRIKQLRENRKMTLKEVAKKLGVTEATAQRYENSNGIKQIPYKAIEKYAEIFGVSPSYIMGWEDADLEMYADSDLGEFVELYEELDDSQRNQTLGFMRAFEYEKQIREAMKKKKE